MTREEATKIITEMMTRDVYVIDAEKDREALNMAIEALQTDLVQCNGCRFFNDKHEECRYYIAHGIRRKSNDFCSNGKPKGGDIE